MSRGGSAATATDPEIFDAIDLLGATEGILTEPAGGTTVASTIKLANEGKLGPDDTVVAVISGNGYKTLDEHPDKPWAEMVSCDVDSMTEMLESRQPARRRRDARLSGAPSTALRTAVRHSPRRKRLGDDSARANASPTSRLMDWTLPMPLPGESPDWRTPPLRCV